ncbi:hypothetical protein [Devosia sp.]|uniref:IS1/IS1595 family N-terminal zinc-binding domain-containing protein n=1 Tax=Devosia sp. TaxID=1871048 RepID=UPI00326361D1
MDCPRCGGAHLIRRGFKSGFQRYSCQRCLRYFTDRPPRFSEQTKALAIQMYLNGMGIRAIGRVLQASPAGVLKWIRKEHAALELRLVQQAKPAGVAAPDTIEMDEIYTYVQKNSSVS